MKSQTWNLQFDFSLKTVYHTIIFNVPLTRNIKILRRIEPQNKNIRIELMSVFGLNPNLDYDKNCELTKTVKIKAF